MNQARLNTVDVVAQKRHTTGTYDQKGYDRTDDVFRTVYLGDYAFKHAFRFGGRGGGTKVYASLCVSGYNSLQGERRERAPSNIVVNSMAGSDSEIRCAGGTYGT